MQQRGIVHQPILANSRRGGLKWVEILQDVKKNYILILSSLLFSLFIYLFYRTEKTVINELLIQIISIENFIELRKSVVHILPLNEHIIYSLPEGLWMFSVSLASKSFFVRIGEREINLLFVPLIFSVGLEFFQLFHLTNGRFDLWDIGISVFFWATANYLVVGKGNRQNILNPFNTNSLMCLLSYLIVYLAHVLN